MKPARSLICSTRRRVHAELGEDLVGGVDEPLAGPLPTRGLDRCFVARGLDRFVHAHPDTLLTARPTSCRYTTVSNTVVYRIHRCIDPVRISPSARLQAAPTSLGATRVLTALHPRPLGVRRPQARADPLDRRARPRGWRRAALQPGHRQRLLHPRHGVAGGARLARRTRSRRSAVPRRRSSSSHPKGDTVEDAGVRSAIEDAVTALGDIGQVEQAVAPFDENVTGAVSEDERGRAHLDPVRRRADRHHRRHDQRRRRTRRRASRRRSRPARSRPSAGSSSATACRRSASPRSSACSSRSSC